MSTRDSYEGRLAPLVLQMAAVADPERLGRLQRLCNAAICTAGQNGLTAIETAKATGFDRYSVQPRISELRRKGLVVASGRRRRNPSGKSATVWIARRHANPAVSSSGQ